MSSLDSVESPISSVRSLLNFGTSDTSTLSAAEVARRIYDDPYNYFEVINRIISSNISLDEDSISGLTPEETEFLKETQIELLLFYSQSFSSLRQGHVQLADVFHLFKSLYSEFRWPVVSAVLSNPSLLGKSEYADAVVHFIAKVEWLHDNAQCLQPALKVLLDMLLGLSACDQDLDCPRSKRNQFNSLCLKYISDSGPSFTEEHPISSNRGLTGLKVADLPLHFLRFVSMLPKAELHAHISGSIRMDTLTELSQLHFDDFDEKLKQCCVRAGSAEKRDLNECFQLFKVLHHIIDSVSVVKRVTYEVLADFVLRDRVNYIELRTTPRNLSKDLNSASGKKQYLEAVCEALECFSSDINHFNTLETYLDKNDEAKEGENQEELPDLEWLPASSRVTSGAPWFIDAKLLVSIDRSDTSQSALETLNVVQDLRSSSETALKRIVGLDFSGNPFVRSFDEFRDVFILARDGKRTAGDSKCTVDALPITVHFAETTNIEDANSILNFAPERLGHAALLTEETYSLVRKKSIPVEICLTSNFACKLHTDLISHPFRRFYEEGHPISLCTDDKGIFISPLIREYLYLIGDEKVIRLGSNNSASIEKSVDDFCADIKRLGSSVAESTGMWFATSETRAKGYNQVQAYVDRFCEELRNAAKRSTK